MVSRYGAEILTCGQVKPMAIKSYTQNDDIIALELHEIMHPESAFRDPLAVRVSRTKFIKDCSEEDIEVFKIAGYLDEAFIELAFDIDLNVPLILANHIKKFIPFLKSETIASAAFHLMATEMTAEDALRNYEEFFPYLNPEQQVELFYYGYSNSRNKCWAQKAQVESKWTDAQRKHYGDLFHACEKHPKSDEVANAWRRHMNNGLKL